MDYRKEESKMSELITNTNLLNEKKAFIDRLTNAKFRLLLVDESGEQLIGKDIILSQINNPSIEYECEVPDEITEPAEKFSQRFVDKILNNESFILSNFKFEASNVLIESQDIEE
jgi:hypothetical protein